MSLDKENRMTVHQDGAAITTYAYAYDGLKRNEQSVAKSAKIVWGGTSYLGEVN